MTQADTPAPALHRLFECANGHHWEHVHGQPFSRCPCCGNTTITETFRTPADTPAPDDHQIRATALRRQGVWVITDLLDDLGLNKLSDGTHVWHVVRDLVDEGLVSRSHDGYRVVAEPRRTGQTP